MRQRAVQEETAKIEADLEGERKALKGLMTSGQPGKTGGAAGPGWGSPRPWGSSVARRWGTRRKAQSIIKDSMDRHIARRRRQHQAVDRQARRSKRDFDLRMQRSAARSEQESDTCRGEQVRRRFRKGQRTRSLKLMGGGCAHHAGGCPRLTGEGLQRRCAKTRRRSGCSSPDWTQR